MSDRLPSGVLVKALIRRVHDAGGSAMVLARGDQQGGALLALLLDRGGDPRFVERGVGGEGRPAIIRSGPRETDDAAITDYWQRRVARDPDLWVVELDIPEAERFVAETIALD
ncbi:DUF1491 family protein [Sphingomonas sp.]|uniref:DUF1491 family protein n=1 Tax=Sphingomonas sp. TaxID=28214 RepID=UPI002CA9C352|nr:DUF1491 family protein [Sphingomonas sp.]HWK35994.1 DUF1491 family protein [Sphingomonas sp.]